MEYYALFEAFDAKILPHLPIGLTPIWDLKFADRTKRSLANYSLSCSDLVMQVEPPDDDRNVQFTFLLEGDIILTMGVRGRWAAEVFWLLGIRPRGYRDGNELYPRWWDKNFDQWGGHEISRYANLHSKARRAARKIKAALKGGGIKFSERSWGDLWAADVWVGTDKDNKSEIEITNPGASWRDSDKLRIRVGDRFTHGGMKASYLNERKDGSFRLEGLAENIRERIGFDKERARKREEANRCYQESNTELDAIAERLGFRNRFYSPADANSDGTVTIKFNVPIGEAEETLRKLIEQGVVEVK